MTKVGSILRLLMIVACLVPFTSPRQAAASFSLAPVEAESPTPAQQREEDETEREEEQEVNEEKAREPHQRFDRLPTALVGVAFPVRAAHVRPPAPALAVPVDHFRNGLGTPYRC